MDHVINSVPLHARMPDNEFIIHRGIGDLPTPERFKLFQSFTYIRHYVIFRLCIMYGMNFKTVGVPVAIHSKCNPPFACAI